MALASVLVFSQINNAESAQMTLENKNMQAKTIAVNGNAETLNKTSQTHLSNQYAAKSKVKKLNLEGKALTLKGIIEKRVDLHAQVASQANGLEVKITYALGCDIFLNEASYAIEYKILETDLTEFAKRQEVKFSELSIKSLVERRIAKRIKIKTEDRMKSGFEKQINAIEKTPNSSQYQISFIEQKVNASNVNIKSLKEAVSEIESAIKSKEEQIKLLKS